MKKRIKFLKKCGKFPENSIHELTDELKSTIESAGWERGEDWDELTTDESLEDTIAEEVNRSLGERLEQSVTQGVEKVLKRLTDKIESRISVIAEPEDKDKKRGYTCLAEFARDVILAGHTPSAPMPEQMQNINVRTADAISRVNKAHLAEYNILKRTVGSDELTTLVGEYGNYLIPTEFSNNLMSEALETSVMLPRVRNITMSSQSITIPAIDDSTHAGVTTFGGVTVYRTNERAQISVSRPKFRQIGLHLHKLAVMIPATDEMLRWSIVSLGPMLGTMSSQAIAWHTDGEIINDGQGTGEPLAITKCPALVSVTRTTASKVKTEDIDKMWQRMPQRYRAGAIWIINADVESELDALVRVVGTGGQLVYNPPSGVADVPYGRLKGRPVLISEHCSGLGTAGDILLVAPGAYLWAQLGSGPEAAASIHLRFDYHETLFRYTLYNDGRPWWNSAFTPKNTGSSLTFSPFVALAA